MDILRYQSHQDCKTLVCFVYDPTGKYNNPTLENDLMGDHGGLRVIVIGHPSTNEQQGTKGDRAMNTPEFVDTYSDDVIYLLEGRTALLTHPLRAELPELLNASTCRLLAVFMIGNIELMLSDWRAKDHNDILNVYFEGRRENRERVAALCSAFQSAGITVDPEVFNDYLAIRYLRNAIVHAKRKDHEKDCLSSAASPPTHEN